MAVGTKILSDSVLNDGSPDGTLSSWSVPTGELYYLAVAHCYAIQAKWSGTNEITVRRAMSDGGAIQSASFSTNNLSAEETKETVIGAYVYPGEVVEIAQTKDGSSNANELKVYVKLRQVL